MNIIDNLIKKINYPKRVEKSSTVEIIPLDDDSLIKRPSLWRRLFLSIIIILVAALAFGLGRLSVFDQKGIIKIEYDPSLTGALIDQQPVVSQKAILDQSQTGVVASKNGTRYHYLHCPGAKQIKEENKISFSTPVEAEAAGYLLAANCLPR